MTTGFSIFLIAAGAVLRYALSYRLTGVDLQALGSIIMTTGAATLSVCAGRAVRTARRRRPAPIARTLPLPGRLPSEDGPTGCNGPANECPPPARSGSGEFCFAGDGVPPAHGPRPGIPRVWNNGGSTALTDESIGFARDVDQIDRTGHWHEGGDRPWPAAASNRAGIDGGHRPVLPPRVSWHLDEAGWPDEAPAPPATGEHS